MITVPLYALFIPYGIFLLIFVIFFIINFLHILLTGTTTVPSFIMTVLVLGLALLTLFGTWYATQNVDWQLPLTIWNSGWISGNGNYF